MGLVWLHVFCSISAASSVRMVFTSGHRFSQIAIIVMISELMPLSPPPAQKVQWVLNVCLLLLFCWCFVSGQATVRGGNGFVWDDKPRRPTQPLLRVLQLCVEESDLWTVKSVPRSKTVLLVFFCLGPLWEWGRSLVFLVWKCCKRCWRHRRVWVGSVSEQLVEYCLIRKGCCCLLWWVELFNWEGNWVLQFLAR